MLDINFLRLEFAAKIQGKAGEKGSLDAALLRVATLAYQQGAIDSHAIHLRPLVIPIGVYPDSERLDWIGEQYLRVGSLGLRSDGRDFEITPAAGGRFKGATLREAIDEAMAAEELARLTAHRADDRGEPCARRPLR